MRPKVLAVIPARLGSSRFPSKVLYNYKGKPLLYYIWREVNKCKQVDRLVIATDSRQVIKESELFGADAIITPKRLKTGSDRAAEIAKKIGGDYIINIQADNFGLKHTVLDKAINYLKKRKMSDVVTFGRRIESEAELYHPNCVKIAVGGNNQALWFSRYPIPFLQKASTIKRAGLYRYYKHIGIYLFRRSALLKFAKSEQTELEKAESLEQLRMLEIGLKIEIIKTRMKTVSVDSPNDVNYLNEIYR